MRYAEAVAAHIDAQYSEYADYYRGRDGVVLMTRTDYANDGGSNFAIAAEVGHRVATKLGELVSFGVFDNCREHGITIAAPGHDLRPDTGWTFCVYEHHNSDQICIEGCPTPAVETWGPYGGVDKYDVLHRSRFEDYDSAAAALVAMLQAATTLERPTRDIMKHIAHADGAPSVRG